MIIDSHVHAWNAETEKTPWRKSWREFAPRPSLDIDELLAEMDEAGVDAAALIPPEWDLGGNDLVLDAAERHPDRLLAFPALSLRDPAAPERLLAWRERAGFGGLRQIFLRAPNYSPLTDGTADWLFRAADDLGLTMMVWMPGQLDALAAVVARYPGIRLTVDHMNLAMRPGADELARCVAGLAALSDNPNLAVKVSALPSMVSEEYPYPSIHPAVRELVEAFGPARVFWGSDFTRLPCSYAQARAMMREIALPDGVGADDITGGSFARWVAWPGVAEGGIEDQPDRGGHPVDRITTKERDE